MTDADALTKTPLDSGKPKAVHTALQPSDGGANHGLVGIDNDREARAADDAFLRLHQDLRPSLKIEKPKPKQA